MAAPASIIGQWLTTVFNVNSVDLSDYVKDFSVSVDRDRFPVPSTSDPYATYLGLDKAELTANFYASYYTALVAETLYAAWNGKTIFTVTGQPTSGALSATNRGFSGSFTLPKYNHINWSIRDEATIAVEFLQAGVITFPDS